MKRRAGYVLVVNCALGVLLFRANRLLDPANTEVIGAKTLAQARGPHVPSLRKQEGDGGF
jgi:hypothetical protein